MPKITSSIVSIVTPIAAKAGVKIHSSAEAKLRSLGRLADAGKVSLDDMVSDIDRICGGYLERKEKEELAKALKRYM